MERNANSVLEACKDGDAEKLSELLAEKCDYVIQNKQGFSPLHLAAEGGHLQCVKLLLQATENDNLSADEVVAKLCHPTFQHETPLSIAAEKGHHEIVELLATLFSKSTTKPDSGLALNIACDKGNIECFHIILKYVPWLIDACERGLTPIEHATAFGSLQSMKLIIEAGADLTEGSKNATRALYRACHEGNYDKVKLLLDSGCAVKGCENTVPLFAAASSDAAENVKLVELLLSRGADPCELTEEYIDMLEADVEVTPLALAASRGNLEIVKILASLTPRSFGPMATFSAALENSDECLQYLFKEGFDTFTSTYFGYSQETLWNAICWDPECPDETKENISKTLKILFENGTKYDELAGGDFFVRAFSDMDLEALNVFCAYGLPEMQFDCPNLPRFNKFAEFLNSVLEYSVSLSNLRDEVFVKVNADFINTLWLVMKYYPFAKFSMNDDSNSADSIDFNMNMILPAVPTLVQMCVFNIRSSIIRKQQQLSSKVVKTLNLPPRLEKLIFNPTLQR